MKLFIFLICEIMIIVDRIENGNAVCEINGTEIKNIPLSQITNNVAEGDVLIDKNGDESFYIIDVEKTNERKEDINERFERLKKKKQD